MIKYKYSFFVDIRWCLHTLLNLKWLKDKKLLVHYPNPLRMIRLFFYYKKIQTFQSEENIICYFIHCGTWGAYRTPNNIYICPWDIEKAGGLERVIIHEIKHLKYAEQTQSMSHEDKEKFINNHK